MTSEIRTAFPILNEYTYLNTARYCALPQSAIDIQKDFLKHLSEHGSWNFDPWADLYEDTRRKSAQLIGCNPDQVFYLPNVSLGFNLAAQYFPKRSVICLNGDFPSVTMTWEPHGFEVTYLDYNALDFSENLQEFLSDPNQIVSVSWIQSSTGFEIDIDMIFKLCKEFGHFLVLDGTQGLGAIPFKIDPDVDCLFLSSGFKWLLAGYGIALGYASPEILKFLKPLRGWNSGFQDSGQIIHAAKSMEVGNATYLNVSALSKGIEIINLMGVDSIREHNLNLKRSIIKGLKDSNRPFRHFESNSSIVSFEATKLEYDLLTQNKIQTTWQNGHIRISPNFYNNAEDIEKLLGLIC